MSSFELRPWNSAQTDASRREIVWADTRLQGTVNSQLDPWLTSFGDVPPHAIDLVRIATGAFLADQLHRRPLSLSRSLDVLVHVLEPGVWTLDLLDDLTDLLASLTGDVWQVAVAPETSTARLVVPELAEGEARPASDRIALLSGGLDSFAGAVVSSTDEGFTYLGHWDQPATKHAQDDARAWFARAGRPIDYVQVLHTVRDRADHSTRSRSFLFMTLAMALAAARGARVVEVPENGFTSLNPPLGPERGGAFTTRSTHPVTISRFNRVLAGIGSPIRVENPHAWRTKGDLVAMARPLSPGDFAVGAALTLSCAKLNGQFYPGGDPNGQCGLCVACLTRRGALIAAGVPDGTEYLIERLAGEARAKLLRNRAGDVEAVRLAIANPIDDLDLMAIGPYPEDYDLDAAVELCHRGLDELARVPLA